MPIPNDSIYLEEPVDTRRLQLEDEKWDELADYIQNDMHAEDTTDYLVCILGVVQNNGMQSTEKYALISDVFQRIVDREVERAMRYE